MDYSALAQLLNQDAQKQAQQNPWLTAANNFSQVNSFDPYGSNSKNMGQTVLKGLLTGLTGAYGNRQVEQDLASRNESLRGFMSAAPEARQGMLQTDQYLKPFAGALAAADYGEQQSLAEQDRSNTEAMKRELTKAKIGGMTPEQLAGATIEKGPDGSLIIKPGEQAIAKPVNDKSLLGRTKSTFQELIKTGYKPAEAGTAASQLLAADRNKAGATYNAIEAGREKAAQLESMAQTAEQGLSMAGRTGSLSSDWGASILGALGSKDQAQKAEGTTLLNSVKPSALAANKVPGMGAMSDFESKAFFAAAPGSDKLPEQNMALITKMKQAAQLENEHADFLETYMNENGTDRGGQAAWNQYKKANPLIVKDPSSGEYVVNPNRRPWADMFGGGVTQQSQQSNYTPEQIAYARAKGISLE